MLFLAVYIIVMDFVSAIEWTNKWTN